MVTMNNAKRDKLVDGIIHYGRNMYWYTVMEAVYITAEYVAPRPADFPKVEGMEHVLVELVHDKLFKSFGGDSTDPLRANSKSIVKQLLDYAEKNPRSRG